MSIIIHSQDLVKTYHNRTVVNQVSVKLEQGEIVGLLGPNGAGKTTTFYMVVGLIKPDSGEVFLNDTDITRLPMYKRAQMGIGYLPQEASVFRKLSVEDNIRAVLEMTKLTRGEQKKKLEALLDEFHLHHVRKNNGDSLSGGERRRTEIARALAVDPKFILLDEPFAGVDPIAVEDIQSVVARLKFRNIGILITDHNVNETLSICDRAYLLIDGKIFKHGTAEELAEDEQVRRLYLGRNFELKRKDYLHEEARNKEMGEFSRPAGEDWTSNKVPTREDIVISVKNAIEELENIKKRKNEQFDLKRPYIKHTLFGHETIGLSNPEKDPSYREEMGIDVFEKMIPGIKASVLKYAQGNHNQELTKIATRLSTDEDAANTDLNDLLLLLEADEL